MRDVKPLGQAKPPKQPAERERRRPRAASRRADEALVLADSLAFDPPTSTWNPARNCATAARRLRIRPAAAASGEYAVRDEIDLHGMTQDEARFALGAFLAEAMLHGRRCVRVIHGKGRGSGHRGPVLKSAVNRWLRRHAAVAAFCSARRNDGGTGALYVLLSR